MYLPLQILAVFKTAPELCTLLRSVEEEYKRAREHHTRARSEGPHADVLPWIQSQVQAFEAGAIATVRDSHVATQVCCKGRCSDCECQKSIYM